MRMSKHIWRGLSCGHAHGDFVLKELGGYKSNSTVVEDDACFPVKEAMRLCTIMASFNYELHSWSRMDDAKDKYIKAVARMKAKKARMA
jgi:hypothetical protein